MRKKSEIVGHTVTGMIRNVRWQMHFALLDKKKVEERARQEGMTNIKITPMIKNLPEVL
jgi:hypothetical protein